MQDSDIPVVVLEGVERWCYRKSVINRIQGFARLHLVPDHAAGSVAGRPFYGAAFCRATFC